MIIGLNRTILSHILLNSLFYQISRSNYDIYVLGTNLEYFGHNLGTTWKPRSKGVNSSQNRMQKSRSTEISQTRRVEPSTKTGRMPTGGIRRVELLVRRVEQRRTTKKSICT